MKKVILLVAAIVAVSVTLGLTSPTNDVNYNHEQYFVSSDTVNDTLNFMDSVYMSVDDDYILDVLMETDAYDYLENDTNINGKYLVIERINDDAAYNISTYGDCIITNPIIWQKLYSAYLDN